MIKNLCVTLGDVTALPELPEEMSIAPLIAHRQVLKED